MRIHYHVIGLFAAISWIGVADAPSDERLPERGVVCPPGVKGAPPTLGGDNPAELSNRLANSQGVICPPAGVDPDIHVPPPGGGKIEVIPPPGTPGGNPNVQPK